MFKKHLVVERGHRPDQLTADRQSWNYASLRSTAPKILQWYRFIHIYSITDNYTQLYILKWRRLVQSSAKIYNFIICSANKEKNLFEKCYYVNFLKNDYLSLSKYESWYNHIPRDVEKQNRPERDLSRHRSIYLYQASVKETIYW